MPWKKVEILASKSNIYTAAETLEVIYIYFLKL